jgi:hypothetical protein
MSGPSARRFIYVALMLACAVSPASTHAQTIAVGTFNAGIYYRLPFLDNPGAMLTRFDDQTPGVIQMAPVGWDMCRDLVVFPTPAGLTIVSAIGTRRTVAPQGLYRYVRPSFSPDCRSQRCRCKSSPV